MRATRDAARRILSAVIAALCVITGSADVASAWIIAIPGSAPAGKLPSAIASYGNDGSVGAGACSFRLQSSPGATRQVISPKSAFASHPERVACASSTISLASLAAETALGVVDDVLIPRPKFRTGRVDDAWANATPGPNGGRLCPTRGDEGFVDAGGGSPEGVVGGGCHPPRRVPPALRFRQPGPSRTWRLHCANEHFGRSGGPTSGELVCEAVLECVSGQLDAGVQLQLLQRGADMVLHCPR